MPSTTRHRSTSAAVGAIASTAVHVDARRRPTTRQRQPTAAEPTKELLAHAEAFLVQQAIEARAEFAYLLEMARGIYRKHPELVTSRTFPHEFIADLREFHDDPDYTPDPNFHGKDDFMYPEKGDVDARRQDALDCFTMRDRRREKASSAKHEPQTALPEGFEAIDGSLVTTPWGEIVTCASYSGITEPDAVKDGDGWEIDALLMDRDGDTIYSGQEERPIHFSNGIGVQIAVTLDPKDAARLLRKVADSLENDGFPKKKHGGTITAAQLPDYVHARFARHEPACFPPADAAIAVSSQGRSAGCPSN